MTTATKTKATTKKPAVRVVAASSAGKRGRLNASDPRITVVEQTATVIPWLIKFAVVGTVVYFGYRAYTNRFTRAKENSNYDPANISESEAEFKANAIYSSVGWTFLDSSWPNLKAQFSGLNYNAVVKVYNAFGKRRGEFFSGDVDLWGFLMQNLSESRKQEIRFLIGTTFF